MKALTSISVVSSLILATLTSAGGTNEPASILKSPTQAGAAIETSNTAVSAQAPLPAPALSRCSAEIVQLTQAGMDEEVVMSFISTLDWFDLSADHVIYLSDLGVSSRVIQAMLAHDREGLARLAQATNITTVSIQAGLRVAPPVGKPAEPNLASVMGADPVPQNVSLGATAQTAAQSEKLLRPQAPAAKRKVLYPIREPHPVELTAPIVFLDAPTF